MRQLNIGGSNATRECHPITTSPGRPIRSFAFICVHSRLFPVPDCPTPLSAYHGAHD